MRIVFVMDPPSTVLVDEDTSFALMLEADARGHRVDHCLVRDVYLDGDRACARLRRATMRRDAASPIALGEAEDHDLADVDAVFIRKDPPFDKHYLWLTLVLEHLRDRTLVVNDPHGLRDANEKLYTHHFVDVMPRTLVSADPARLRRFVHDVGGRAIGKPVDGHGGSSVFGLSAGDRNINALVETLTAGGTQMAIAQAFVPEVVEGDKRILLVEGEPLGAILRVPRPDDVRSNIHVGGTVVPTELTERDLAICARLAPRLRDDGLFFVGIDVIGNWLTEVNVTSPTGIQQMSRLSGENLPARVIARMETRAQHFPR